MENQQDSGSLNLLPKCVTFSLRLLAFLPNLRLPNCIKAIYKVKTAGQKKIAERYVRALFDVSDKARDQVEKDLTALEAALEGSEEFRRFLSNPLLTREVQAKVMNAVLTKINAQKVTKDFMALLAKQKRLPLLPEIISMFREWARTSRGELSAELIAPTPLNVRVVDMVEERLSKVYGKKVIVKMRHDPSLLGGVVVKIGSLQLDSSLAGKMRRLKNKLQAA